MTAPSVRELVARLRALAEKATPGPWCWEFTGEKSNDWAVGVAVGPDDKPIAGQLTTTDDEAYAGESGAFMDEAVIRHTFIGEGDNVADAAYLAACDPQTILALCDALDALGAPTPEPAKTETPLVNAANVIEHFGQCPICGGSGNVLGGKDNTAMYSTCTCCHGTGVVLTSREIRAPREPQP